MIDFCPQRRNKKLFINGYAFSKDTQKRGWSYWRCSGYRRTG